MLDHKGLVKGHLGQVLSQPCGVQRSDDARINCLVLCPLPNSCFEQWRKVPIGTVYTLFVTVQFDVIFMFANHRFGEVC